MTHTEYPSAPEEPATKPGRKRDHSLDPKILDAALEVLAEVGYDGMTLDAVAARAKAGKATLYRRWSSKSELVLDAVACMKTRDRGHSELPDTGDLRNDLIAMLKPPSMDDSEKRLRVMGGLASMVSRNPEFTEAVRESILGPKAKAYRLVLERAAERGEIPRKPTSDMEMFAQILPAMTAFRMLMTRNPPDRKYFIHLIDAIVLPALQHDDKPA